MKWTFRFSRRMKVRGLRSPCAAPEAGRPESAPDGAQMNRGENAAGYLSESSSHTGGLAAMAYIEIVVIGGLAPAAVLWFSHPQWLQLVLPLWVLGPLLLGLYFGFAAGTGGALLTAAVLAGITYLKPDLLGEFPKVQAICLLLVGMGAGEARDVWAARTHRLDYLCHYHQFRLEQFTSGYRLLQVSHSQLERRVAGSANSLRAALERIKLREPLFDAADSEPLGGIGDWLLEIMVETGKIHAAAVYEMSGSGILCLPPTATVGSAPDLSVFNPLLRETLRTGRLTSVHAGNEAVHEHVIAVVPLIDATGHIHGIVSITDMPFLNINQETFELLGVLGRHIGDILASRTRPMAQTQGPCALRESLQRNLVDARKHAVPAAVVACKIVDVEHRDALIARCCHSSRGLDQSWISINRRGQPVVVKLLPVTDKVGARSYLARLESEEAGGHAERRGIVTFLWMLDQNRTADEILTKICVVCETESLDPSSVNPPHVTSEVAL